MDLRNFHLVQVVKIFPELASTVRHLWDNHRIWADRLADEVDSSADRSPAEREAEKVSIF